MRSHWTLKTAAIGGVFGVALIPALYVLIAATQNSANDLQTHAALVLFAAFGISAGLFVPADIARALVLATAFTAILLIWLVWTGTAQSILLVLTFFSSISGSAARMLYKRKLRHFLRA